MIEDAPIFQRAVLQNGLRVVTTRRASSPLVAVKLFFKVGSRHDATPGVTHFLEHLLFSNPTQAIYDTVEAIGGEANAVTTREYTALQAVVLAPHLEMVINRLADLLEVHAVDPAWVEHEREVILEEIKLHSDSQQIIWDLFLQALWDGDALARPVTGTPESVSAITTEDLNTHLSHYRAADRIVVATAGRVDHEALVRLVESRFGTLQPAGPIDTSEHGLQPPGHTLAEKDLHQTHLALGVEAPQLSDPRRHAVRLLDIILGRGASSRLHRTLRTHRGLVYHVSSVAMGYEDRGYLAVYTACSPERVREVSGVIINELDRAGREGVTDQELAAAKTNYEGSLARNFETVLSLASIVGIEELLSRIEPFAESIARIRAVTVEQVHQVAAEFLKVDRCAMAMVGRRVTNA